MKEKSIATLRIALRHYFRYKADFGENEASAILEKVLPENTAHRLSAADEQCILAFGEFLDRLDFSKHTRKRYLKHVRVFARSIAWTGDGLAQIHPHAVKSYLDGLCCPLPKIFPYPRLSALRSFFHFMAETRNNDCRCKACLVLVKKYRPICSEVLPCVLQTTARTTELMEFVKRTAEDSVLPLGERKRRIGQACEFVNFMSRRRGKQIQNANDSDVHAYLKILQISFKSDKAVADGLTAVAMLLESVGAPSAAATAQVCATRSDVVAVRQPEVLPPAAVRGLLAVPDASTFRGKRDVVILYFMYCCGLRISEVLNLKINSLHFFPGGGSVEITNNYLSIPVREVCFGKKTATAARAYLRTRAALLVKTTSTDNEKALFLKNESGAPIGLTQIMYLVRKHSARCGAKTYISRSALRHSFIAHLLAQNADMSSVAMLIGLDKPRAIKPHVRAALERAIRG